MENTSEVSQHDAYEAYERGDYAKALRLYAECVERGDLDASINLAAMYAKGYGTSVDLDRAEQLLARGVALRMAEAVYTWGMVRKLRGDRVGFATAAKEAADLGLLEAQTAWALCLMGGYGTPKSPSLGLDVMRTSAAAGEIRAVKFLARRLVTRPTSPWSPLVGAVRLAMLFGADVLMKVRSLLGVRRS